MILEKQTAIVTGAGRGIGKAIARTLAQEGAQVVVVDIDPQAAGEAEKALRAEGLSAVAHVADISRGDDVAALVEHALTLTGKIDILVNVAGLISNTPFLDLPEEEWDRVLAVNLRGVFVCSQRCGAVMARQRSGRIISIASLAGKVGAPGQAAYSASKHGVLGLTKVMAIDLAPYGINVNAICPGSTETEMMRYVMTRRAASRNQTYEELTSGILTKTPLGRFGRPEDVAGVVLFLASPAAAYITGQSIDVDGGRSINLS